MADKPKASPYQLLGKKLRQLREKHRETLAEVSGAVEIDEKQLVQMEAGKDRPSEDILMLLMSHFGVSDDKIADELWALAGYNMRHEQDHNHEDARHDDHDDMKRTAAMMIMLDPRVMYSDSVEVISNKQGVIINFSQTAGADAPHLTISRVGMSYDQAKAVMGILHQVLYNHDNPTNARRLSDGGATKEK